MKNKDNSADEETHGAEAFMYAFSQQWQRARNRQSKSQKSVRSDFEAEQKILPSRNLNFCLNTDGVWQVEKTHG